MLAVGVLVVAAASPRRGPGRAARPDILFVSLDTLRADHCSTYGYDRPTTPNLERLASRGVRFDAAYAPMPTTLPSHATMFTGLLPRTLGVLKNGVPVPDDPKTLAEVLREAGYRTAAFVSSFVLDRRFGLARGFDTYDDRFTRAACKRHDASWEGFRIEHGFCRRGAQTREQAEAWLAANGYLDEERSPDLPPYLLWIHLFDPHDPYDPPPAERALFPPRGSPPTELDQQIAAYDGEIRYTDDQVGRLLDRIGAAGRLDDTLVVVVGDHGEGLMDHGWMRHGAMLYEEAVRVPFLVSWPSRLAPGRTVGEPVALADLVPTFLDLLDLPPLPRMLDGTSLVGALDDGEPLEPRRPVFLQRRIYDSAAELGLPFRGEKLGVRMGRWKYIEARRERTYELFDLARDPGELQNVFRASRSEAAAAIDALRALRARPVAAQAAPAEASEETTRRLEALGYVE